MKQLYIAPRLITAERRGRASATHNLTARNRFVMLMPPVRPVWRAFVFWWVLKRSQIRWGNCGRIKTEAFTPAEITFSKRLLWDGMEVLLIVDCCLCNSNFLIRIFIDIVRLVFEANFDYLWITFWHSRSSFA